MTVTYHAGRRIQATSTDFGTAGAGIPAVAGGWKEVGRTTLGSAGNLDISSLPDKRYYMFLNETLGTGHSAVRFNSDTGSNYSRRTSFDGSIDYTAVSQDHLQVGNGNGYPGFNVGYIANKSDKEKLLMSWNAETNTSGAANAPHRREFVGKWANTASAISTMNNYNRADGSGNFDSGSEAIVLGWDPADTHTTNFWEELASVTLGSAGSTIDSGTITAKKYLWFQIFNGGLSSSGVTGIRFNSDGSNNYAERRSGNGGSDVTGTSRPVLNLVHTGTTTPQFSNCFVINNSSNEKLVISNSVSQNTAGAGTAPNRSECADKWANTSSQITSIQAIASAGNFPSGSILKVWGSN